ncbi:hypothetical protein [Arthrobacter sp. B1805]|uniref:hypothetical protein n=1 Tax=Arthrobacter sp. B1805 TaxID=2058892 RepID=UPI0011B08861|nr:hypothetical protein [Arthrobacter sp. B1805]
MRRRSSPRADGQRHVHTVVAAVLACLVLASCTGTQEGEGGAVESSVPAASPTPEPTTAPLREAREGWKVFTDPSRLVSFELPEAWVVQPLQPEPGAYAPDSLHYAVRTPEGTTAAELHSGILTQEAPCPDADRTPYYVIGSEPLELTGQPPAATDIEPRFVIRLITGFRFFGSYGITDQVGGADALACSLSNTVQGSEALGRFSFGDLEVLAPKAPANTGPATVSFGTIGEAEAYYGTPEFASIRSMIQSVQIATDPPGQGG